MESQNKIKNRSAFFLSAASLAVMAAFLSLQASTEHIVMQVNRKFSVDTLEIKVGDTVSFPNGDDFFHNVYSLSPTKIFDLGSYPKGQTRKVTFDKKGTVDVRCAIHPEMKMTIIVK